MEFRWLRECLGERKYIKTEVTNSRIVIKTDGVTRSGRGNVFTPLLGDGSHYAGEVLYRPVLITTYSYSSSSDVNLMSLHLV